MDRDLRNFEDVFRQTLQGNQVQPSPDLLRKLRFRLWVSDFFGLNPGKMNILYTTLLVGGIITGVVLLNDDSAVNESRDTAVTDTVLEKTEVKEEAGQETAETPEVAELAEHTASTPALSAEFDVHTLKGCAPLTLSFANQSVRAEKYKWEFGTGESSTKKNPEYTYVEPGVYTATLTASDNEGREMSFSREIEVMERPRADFLIDVENSDMASRRVVFKNTSERASTYTWLFGDNTTSSAKSPAHVYPNHEVYRVTLVAENTLGCSDTAILVNKFIEKDYTLAFPLNFRPNPYTRGENGFYEKAGSDAAIFYPRNKGVKEYELSILAPNGIEVFSTKTIKQGWNGYIGGRLAPAGTYTYRVEGVYPNGQVFQMEGKFKVLVEEYY